MEVTEELLYNGFAIIDNIYTKEEAGKMLYRIGQANTAGENFRNSTELFAIRQFLKEVPATADIIFNDKLKTILDKLFSGKYFVVKSIYFDKPPSSNWYVAYHQDLTISVDKKLEVKGFEFWTKKQNQFAVQPPLEILQNIVTVRIHLDETDENNGALKVFAKSHLNGVCRPEVMDRSIGQEVNCNVCEGGIMIMKPLLMHGSGRTTNNKQRRVIHIEFSDVELPKELSWAERINLNRQSQVQ
jgi:hypothetical protein